VEIAFHGERVVVYFAECHDGTRAAVRNSLAAAEDTSARI